MNIDAYTNPLSKRLSPNNAKQVIDSCVRKITEFDAAIEFAGVPETPQQKRALTLRTKSLRNALRKLGRVPSRLLTYRVTGQEV